MPGDDETGGGTGVTAWPSAIPRLGAPVLRVSDRVRSTAFYTGVLGMTVLAEDDTRTMLGVTGDRAPLLVLDAAAPAAPAPRTPRLGLFHIAYLLPSRADLARVFVHLRAQGVRLAASDHAVSEALYLSDPDGLGIEIYADRPRASWRAEGGELHMTTEALDLASLLGERGDVAWTGMPAGTRVGHVHLSVADLADARRRYVDGLGLAVVVSRYPGALFLSRDGYHHHLAVNTWQGPHAAAPRADEARLLAWTIRVASSAELTACVARLRALGLTGEPDGRGFTVPDGTGPAVRIEIATAAGDASSSPLTVAPSP